MQVGRCGADCGADLEVPDLAALRQALPGLWQHPARSTSFRLPRESFTPEPPHWVPAVAMGQGVDEGKAELLERVAGEEPAAAGIAAADELPREARQQQQEEARSREIAIAAGR